MRSVVSGVPVRSEQELGERCRRILKERKDLEPVVLSMLFERFSQLSREEGREEGREAGRQQEAAALAIRQLHRRFQELGPAASERIASLPLPRLEQLAVDLLDFTGPDLFPPPAGHLHSAP